MLNYVLKNHRRFYGARVPDRTPGESSPRGMRFIHVWSLLLQANKIDAVTIDGALAAEAGLPHYNLKPIMAEYYGLKDGVSSLGLVSRVWHNGRRGWQRCCRPCSLLLLWRQNVWQKRLKEGKTYLGSQLEKTQSSTAGRAWQEHEAAGRSASVARKQREEG